MSPATMDGGRSERDSRSVGRIERLYFLGRQHGVYSCRAVLELRQVLASNDWYALKRLVQRAGQDDAVGIATFCLRQLGDHALPDAGTGAKPITDDSLTAAPLVRYPVGINPAGIDEVAADFDKRIEQRMHLRLGLRDLDLCATKGEAAGGENGAVEREVFRGINEGRFRKRYPSPRHPPTPWSI